MSDQNSWVTWAVVGSAAAVTIAGVSYLVYSNFLSEDEAASSNAAEEAATTSKLQAAKAIQMQSLTPAPASPSTSTAPALPARQEKSNPAIKNSSSTGAAVNRGTCAHCSKPTAGLPLRCSGCKQVYYCSQDCQKKAWPEHKAQCKASKQPAAPAPSSGSPAVEGSGPVAPATPGTAPAAQDPKNLQEALAQYLEEAAASKTDELEATFERAVMLFVRSEFPACIEKLLAAQAMAKERGIVEMQGEAFKWLGHAHNRMGDTTRAEAYFNEGIEWAKEHHAIRLQVDCLGGLGAMYKFSGDPTRSIELLEQALALCEGAGHEENRANTLCSLGEVLMKVDPKRGLACLRESVAQRDQAVERLHAAGERNGLATAVMEHSNALVSLATALMLAKEWQEAEACFLRALEVFELVEDTDKVIKVLVSLANLRELSVGGSPADREQARQYRVHLLTVLEQHGVNRPSTECSVCKAPIAVKGVTQSPDEPLIMLSCSHCLHHSCWNGWVAQQKASSAAENSACPICTQRAAVPVQVDI